MSRRPTRAAMLAALALLAAPAMAHADITSSQITTPSDPTFRVYDDSLPPADPANQVTVSGTTNGGINDAVDIACFYTTYSGNATYNDWKDDVPVAADGSFSTTIDGPSTDDQTCRLRAVPSAGYDTTEKANFSGPVVNIANYQKYTRTVSGTTGGAANTVEYDNYLGGGGARGGWEWDSAASCGPYDAQIYQSGAFQRQEESIFDCVLDLYSSDGTGHPAISVDNAGAEAVAALPNLRDPDGAGPLVGGLPANAQGIAGDTVSRSGSDITHSWSEPLQRCDPDPSVAPSRTSCTSVAQTGVRLDRKIQMVDGGVTVAVTDTFVSTDGAAHDLKLAYENDLQYYDLPELWFPGEATFAVFGDGDTPSMGTTAPATVFARDVEYPDGGSVVANGALTSAALPEDGVVFNSNNQSYLARYHRTIPAGGSVTLAWRVSLGRNGAEATAVAASDVKALTPPAPPAPAPGPAPAPKPPVLPAVMCVIPTVRSGSTITAARLALKNAHCGAAKHHPAQRSRTVRLGRVVSLGHRVGLRLPAGTPVAIKVSAGKPLTKAQLKARALARAKAAAKKRRQG